MKLSIETKVAAAVAAGFLALTAGAIAQSQSSGQPPNANAPSTSPSVNTQMGQRGPNDSSNANQTGQTSNDESASSNRPKKITKHRSKTVIKHRPQRTQQKQDTQTKEPATNPGG